MGEKNRNAHVRTQYKPRSGPRSSNKIEHGTHTMYFFCIGNAMNQLF